MPDHNIKNSPNDDATAPTSKRIVFSPEHPNILSQSTGWELDFRQVGKGHLDTNVVQHSAMGCTISKIAMSADVHQMGQPPDNEITFGIPDPEGITKWQGGPMEMESFVTFGSKTGFDSISNSRHVGTTVSFDKATLIAFCETSGIDLSDSVFRSNKFDIGFKAPLFLDLKKRISLLFGLDTIQWSKMLREELMLDTLRLVSNGRALCENAGTSKRRLVLNKTIDLINENEDEIIPISSMCREVGASWRTINRAFWDEFGFGPKAYYTRFRLNRVRLELAKANEPVSVSSAANRYEFWHMGQFARDYQLLFCELPSSTLARVKKIDQTTRTTA